MIIDDEYGELLAVDRVGVYEMEIYGGQEDGATVVVVRNDGGDIVTTTSADTVWEALTLARQTIGL